MSIPTRQGYIPLHPHNFSVAVHEYLLSYTALYTNLIRILSGKYKVHRKIEVTSV